MKSKSDEKVVALIEGAIDIILKRGQSIGVMYDPKTGAVDAVGALYLSSGVKESDLLDPDDLDFQVPQMAIPILYESIECIEHCVGEYITTWSDRNGLNEIINDLRFVADYVARRLK